MHSDSNEIKNIIYYKAYMQHNYQVYGYRVGMIFFLKTVSAQTNKLNHHHILNACGYVILFPLLLPYQTRVSSRHVLIQYTKRFVQEVLDIAESKHLESSPLLVSSKLCLIQSLPKLYLLLCHVTFMRGWGGEKFQ